MKESNYIRKLVLGRFLEQIVGTDYVNMSTLTTISCCSWSLNKMKNGNYFNLFGQKTNSRCY